MTVTLNHSSSKLVEHLDHKSSIVTAISKPESDCPEAVGNRKFDASAPTDETSKYQKKSPADIKPAARDLLIKYTGLAPEEVESHVLALRDKAFKIRPYPCIGHIRFLALSLSGHPRYSEVLQRLKGGDAFLDVGCCFGQELRKLTADGVSSTQLYGIDLEPTFVNFGYELFRDKDRFQATFLSGDMFQDSPNAFVSLSSKIDIVWASSFLHLFDWSDQLELCIRITGFVRKRPGSMIMGRQLGSIAPGYYPLQDLMAAQPFWHDPASFEQLWSEVGTATATKWRVEAVLDDEELNYANSKEWGHPAMRRLLFTVILE